MGGYFIISAQFAFEVLAILHCFQVSGFFMRIDIWFTIFRNFKIFANPIFQTLWKWQVTYRYIVMLMITHKPCVYQNRIATSSFCKIWHYHRFFVIVKPIINKRNDTNCFEGVDKYWVKWFNFLLRVIEWLLKNFNFFFHC